MRHFITYVRTVPGPHDTDDIFKVMCSEIKVTDNDMFFSPRRATSWRFSASRGLYSVSETRVETIIHKLPAIFVHASL